MYGSEWQETNNFLILFELYHELHVMFKDQKDYNLSLKHCRTDKLSFHTTADGNMASFNEICAEAAAMLVSLTYVEQYDVVQWAI